MSVTESPTNNLKERIAALQQRNSSPSPTPSPTLPPHDASLTLPRGTLRDKIAKFERKGGVPIPRGSFAMGTPPPEEAGSTKSRELYGNRVAALGKGRPTAPGNACQRAVTSPAAPSTSLTSRNSPDDQTSNSAAQLTPNPISDFACPCPPTPPSPNDFSNVTDRPDSSPNPTDGDDEVQETAVQLVVGVQLDSPIGTQDANSSEPSKTSTNSTSPTTHPLSSVSKSSSSTGFVVTILTPGDVSPTQPRATSSDDTSTHVRRPTTSITAKASPTPTKNEEHSPVISPKSDIPTVQRHIAVEPVPVKESTISPGFRPDRPSQNGSLATSSIRSVPSSVTQLPSLNVISSTGNLKEGSTSSIPSNASIPDKIKTIPPSSSSASTSSNVSPSNISSTGPRVSGDPDESTTMSLSPVVEPGRRSFSAVVHRGDGDSGSDPRNSTTSRSSTITPRPSTSSFKAGTDGGVVRSKRNFKHLGTVAVDPPPSPGLGDLGAGDLAALLQEAALLEQRLYDETATVSSDLGEEGQKAEISAPLPAAATKAAQATAPAPAATTSSRTKGRGLTLGSFTSALSSHTSHSPIRSSPSTPSFQVHPDASPTQPKFGRGRKYFSLRGALRGQRLSMSSEMSSDDSAPVATPPSPSFDLQASQGHGNDSMSIRSMFSIRSNKSGKSDSGPGSLRLSPRRGMSRASSFAERLLNRASKTKSMLDDPEDTIPERSPMLPPIIPEAPGSLLDIAPISVTPKDERSFDRDIFDAFPNVPSEIPQRPASYLFPVPPKTAPPVEQSFRHSSTIGISTTQTGSRDKLGWLRS